jgi:mRNA-degrading endonuclease RelE of RelBE toxin-antitoxin system
MILVDQIKIQLTASFKKVVKKLNKSQKQDLDAAVRQVQSEPFIGEQKKGDLSYLRVYKFKMNKQPCLLGYSYDDGALVLQLIALGSHENFYRDLKR